MTTTSWIARLFAGKALRAAQTAAAHAEARLKALEAELKVRNDIMDMTSIVSEADTHGNLLSVNEKFVEVSRYGRHELVGQGESTTRHPDTPREVLEQMSAAMARGDIFRAVVKNRAKDGSAYYVDAVTAPVRDDSGKAVKFLSVRYDITRQELERQNAQAILAAVDASYAYIEFDLTGHVLHANGNFLRTLGYSLDEVKGRHHRMFCDPALTASPAYADFWRDLNAGVPQNDLFRRLAKSGQDVFIQAVYAPVKDELGRVVKVVKIATDVTAQIAAAFHTVRCTGIDTSAPDGSRAPFPSPCRPGSRGWPAARRCRLSSVYWGAANPDARQGPAPRPQGL